MQTKLETASSSNNHQAGQSLRDQVDHHEQEVDIAHSCPHCPLIFSTVHDMAGHQNAHRRNRDEVMRETYASRWININGSSSLYSSSLYGFQSLAPPIFGLGFAYGVPTRFQTSFGYEPEYGVPGIGHNSPHPPLWYGPMLGHGFMPQPGVGYRFRFGGQNMPAMNGSYNCFPSYLPPVQRRVWRFMPTEQNLLGENAPPVVASEETNMDTYFRAFSGDDDDDDVKSRALDLTLRL